MPQNPTLTKAKLALRVTTTAFDAQITDLISAAQADLGIAGVVVPSTLDTITTQAIITYCQMNFGHPDDYDSLKRSYDEQKAQLATCTGYTTWVNENG